MARRVALVSPTREFLQQWDYLLSSFPPDRLWVIGELPDMPQRSPFSRAVLAETAESLPADPLVVLAPRSGRHYQGEISLLDFEPTDDSIFLFGPDHLPLSDDHLGSRRPSHLVYIPTATEDDLYSWVAAAIVFWDLIRG
ncbi:MAG: hypothetical protein R3253_05725 [Longimicrobiales bacterium]|nr:hypothetical protein [Longimicrobiales bacterium]